MSMKVEFNDSEHKTETNPSLKEKVEKNTELKDMIVSYVGLKKKPENDEVTVEMIIDVFSTDFPEFLMPIAEENYIRGYEQALDDVEKTIPAK